MYVGVLPYQGRAVTGEERILAGTGSIGELCWLPQSLEISGTIGAWVALGQVSEPSLLRVNTASQC